MAVCRTVADRTCTKTSVREQGRNYSVNWGGEYSYLLVLPDEFLLKSAVIKGNFKRNSSGRTRIYEYSPPPPINALVSPLCVRPRYNFALGPAPDSLGSLCLAACPMLCQKRINQQYSSRKTYMARWSSPLESRFMQKYK